MPKSPQTRLCDTDPQSLLRPMISLSWVPILSDSPSRDSGEPLSTSHPADSPVLFLSPGPLWCGTLRQSAVTRSQEARPTSALTWARGQCWCLLPVPSTRTARCLSVFLTHLITQVAAASAFALPKSRAPSPPVARASGPPPAEGPPLILPFLFMIYKAPHRCCTFYLN